MLTHQQSRFVAHGSPRIKSLDTAGLIFVIRVPERSLTVVILGSEMKLEKLIFLVKDHQAIYNACNW